MIENIDFSDIPYHLEKTEKQPKLLRILNELVQWHRDRCNSYRMVLDALPDTCIPAASLEKIPLLPVQIFKMNKLSSVPENEVVKTLTSSGTTSQLKSVIYLDRETALLQTKALVSIMKSFIGNKRLPMIIIDTKSAINDHRSFSARAAGILGFSNFGRNHFYLFDEFMNIDWPGLNYFLEKHRNQKIFLFGFTYMVWQYFYMACMRAGIKIDLGDSILIHGGGWKKLKEESVNNTIFKEILHEQLGIKEVCNYYGMIEQVGSIFMECEKGYLHTPDFSDILIREPRKLDVLPNGNTGLVQVFSVLPRSYPGHSILTEDIGTIAGEDDCLCGRKGKYFKIEGRIQAAELRGCSDTYAYN